MNETLMILILFWFFYLSFRIFRNVPTYFDNFALRNTVWDMIWWWCEVLKIKMPGNFASWIFGKMIGCKGKIKDE